MIRFVQGWKFNARAKSGLFVSPDYFEYFIDRTKTEKAGIKVPNSLMTITAEKADQKHFFLRESGLVVIKQRLETPDVKYHREQANKLDELKKVIISAYESNRDAEITSEWLQLVVDKYVHPENFIIKNENKKSFYELVEDYIVKRQLAESHARVYRVLSREVARFEDRTPMLVLCSMAIMTVSAKSNLFE